MEAALRGSCWGCSQIQAVDRAAIGAEEDLAEVRAEEAEDSEDLEAGRAEVEGLRGVGEIDLQKLSNRASHRRGASHAGDERRTRLRGIDEKAAAGCRTAKGSQTQRR